ncbi:L-methionine/D-methionine ABC transporter membrane subunit [Pararobbsia alpina]|uniref:methionine ABC transporter permease n=1 Tax=Pararobbsia alpina TaxID=621374 RepID=UPI0039A47DD9
MFSNVDWLEIGHAGIETLQMLGGSLFFTLLLGLPLGLALYMTLPGGLYASRRVYGVLSLVINVLRSLPFIILLIVMIPLTLVLTGTSIGVAGAIPPLVVGAAPFFARLVENVLREIDREQIEAGQTLGATTAQIVWRIILPEALPGLVGATTVTAIALVSYTAMSGVIGGGGLGDLAVRYGYQRFETDVMVVTVVLLLILVYALQVLGDHVVGTLTRRTRRQPG